MPRKKLPVIKRNGMTEEQLKKAIEDLKKIQPVRRGGRPSQVVPDKKKDEAKNACRNWRLK